MSGRKIAAASIFALVLMMLIGFSTSAIADSKITIVVLAALLPIFIRVLSSSGYRGPIEEILYILLVSIAGLLTGMEFPVASALYSHHGARVGKTAGMLDSADHIGACCGALVVGMIFIPLLGITVSCYFISALNLSSVLFLFFTYEKEITVCSASDSSVND